ncbi:hypothetical protein ACX1NB_02365 [Mycoplasma sp. HF14]
MHSQARNKFKSWCIQALVAIDILANDGTNIKISEKYKLIVDKYLSFINCKDSLFYEADDNNIAVKKSNNNARRSILTKLVLANAEQCYFKEKIVSVKVIKVKYLIFIMIPLKREMVAFIEKFIISYLFQQQKYTVSKMERM